MSCNLIGYCDSDGKLNNKDTYGYRRSASSYDKNNARYFKFNKDKGKLNRNNRNNALPIRPVLKHSYRLIFFHAVLRGLVSFYKIIQEMLDKNKLLLDLFQAYYNARKYKRNKNTTLAFEMNYEANIFALRNDLVEGRYTIRSSISFVINDPVQREIFAADFHDRIVHHLIYNYIYEIFDRYFIYDSYSCRLEKGTHFGIKRVEHFIRSCTQNYSRDAYILKLDIKGFFMHIDKQILFDQIDVFLSKKRESLSVDYDFLIALIHKVIFHDCTQHCYIKGSKSDWNGLSTDKSLFHSPVGAGLAIGNLTSQLFANIYLDALDKYITHNLGFKYYGRYVDDFVLIHQDKNKLLDAIPKIRDFLSDKLRLTLHPKKIYLQDVRKGVQFLGAYIKPYRTYIRKRTIGNFYKKVKEVNKSKVFDKELMQSIVNSYLGILAHYKTFKIRKKVIGNFSNRFWSQFHFTKSYAKAIPHIRKLTSAETRKLYPQGYFHGNLR